MQMATFSAVSPAPPAPTLSGLTCSNASMTESGSDNCTVTLSGRARERRSECEPGEQQCGGYRAGHGGGSGECDQRRVHGDCVIGHDRTGGDTDGERGQRFQELCPAAECSDSSSQLTISPSNLAFGNVTVKSGIDAACDADLHGDGVR